MTSGRGEDEPHDNAPKKVTMPGGADRAITRFLPEVSSISTSPNWRHNKQPIASQQPPPAKLGLDQRSPTLSISDSATTVVNNRSERTITLNNTLAGAKPTPSHVAASRRMERHLQSKRQSPDHDSVGMLQISGLHHTSFDCRFIMDPLGRCPRS
jgi:hypothetical protein